MYDGFISYSHAADDLLAPRLQAGLQRFAKPWWKRRALRIFRDESSLSANPHLWSSIVEALNQSEWFVLLLSPDAAQSEWVNQEIEHWTTHKDPSRILPVVTDGDFGWNGHGRVTGSSVPRSLHGVFTEEPRWVDLRFAKDEEQLDLKNPAFSDAVADVASAIREMPKDELASEEVKQHRRTVRTAWAAGIMLLAVSIAAVGFGIQSANNAREIEIERQKAVEAQAEAVEKAALARSQELAAASTSALETDPELASLLAIRSIQEAPNDPLGASLRALRKADLANLLRLRIPFEGLSYVEATSDGESIIGYSNTLELASFSLEDGSPRWRTDLSDRLADRLSMAVSPSGSVVVVTGVEPGTEAGVVLVISLADGTVRHSFTTDCVAGWSSGAHPFSPDGAVLALGTGDSACHDDVDHDWISFLDTSTWEEIDRLQVPGWIESVAFGNDPARLMVYDTQGNSNRVEIRSFPDLALIDTFESENSIPCCPAITPDGVTIAFSRGSAGLDVVGLHDLASGDFLGYAEGQGLFLAGTGFDFSPEGDALVVTSRDGRSLIKSTNGRLIKRFGSTEATFDVAFGSDGSTLVTSHEGRLEVWDLGDRSGPASLEAGGVAVSHINPNRLINGPATAVHGFVGTLGVDSFLQVLVVDQLTGETIASVQAANAAQLPDGRFVIVEQTPTVEAMGTGFAPNHPEAVIGGLAIWDPETNEMTHLTVCEILLSETDAFSQAPRTLCDNGEPVFGGHSYGEPWISVSPNGKQVAASSQVLSDTMFPCEEESHRMIRIWEVATADEVGSVEIDGCEELGLLGEGWVMTQGMDLRRGGTIYSVPDGEVIAEFPFPGARYVSELTPDGRFIITVGGTIPTALIIDTSDWSVVTRWDAHPSQIRGVAISADGDRFATSGEDGTIRIWSLEAVYAGEVATDQSPSLLDEIPTAIASDMRWIDDQTLGVVHRNPAGWQILSLDSDDVVSDVLGRLARSFSDVECQAYRIDPCPTLDEMRSR